MLEYQIINIHNISSEEYAYYFSLMSEKKKARIQNYAHETDRKRSIAGEMAARQLIAGHSELPIESLCFAEGENGKPYLENGKLFFNISHSEECVLCAVSDREVGADIEKIRDIPVKLPFRFFSEEENAYILEENLLEVERQKRFFEVWTFKEAALKKQGLRLAQLQQNDYFLPGMKTLLLEIDGYLVCIVTEE